MKFSQTMLVLAVTMASGCATAHDKDPQHSLRANLTDALNSSEDVPEGCSFSLKMESKDFDEIEKEVLDLPPNSDFGVFARLGGEYLYSNYLLVLPARDGIKNNKSQFSENISANDFSKISNEIQTLSIASDAQIKIHDECSLLFFRHSGILTARVILSSKIDGMDSIELSDMTRAFEKITTMSPAENDR